MSAKIAITVAGTQGLEGIMDPRFGRTQAFLYVDAGTGEVLEQEINEAGNAAHGAGTSAAAAMSEHGVKAVISGRFGPKAYDALEALGVEMWIAGPGFTAQQALDGYRAGSLKRMKVEVYR